MASAEEKEASQEVACRTKTPGQPDLHTVAKSFPRIHHPHNNNPAFPTLKKILLSQL